MIVKTVNSYDIHIYGQILRMVENSELRAEPEEFKVKELLLNEPRGNKYMNLLLFDEKDSGTLEITIDSVIGIENREILVKSFLSSLVDRGRIGGRDSYTVEIDGEAEVYDHNGLEETLLHEVDERDGVYEVNRKKLKFVNVGLRMDIQNITSIKKEIKTLNDGTYDYLVLNNEGKHAVANKNNDILPYPIIEVVSLLDSISRVENTTTLNGDNIKIQDGKFIHLYQLVANSQFYIDHTDIYKKGFVIK